MLSEKDKNINLQVPESLAAEVITDNNKFLLEQENQLKKVTIPLEFNYSCFDQTTVNNTHSTSRSNNYNYYNRDPDSDNSGSGGFGGTSNVLLFGDSIQEWALVGMCVK